MNGISTFLWFDDRALEAAQYYVSVFPDSRITSGETLPNSGSGPDREGPPVSLVSFELAGRPFTALNGGPVFSFTPAISFVIACEDQAEVDYYWDRLVDGGEPSQCGWLVDRFGVSWQVVPTMLGNVLSGPDPDGCARATAAMLEMAKLDIATLQAAYRGDA
jgi:predicted 3-demethylubiquinone-9 3-methyltransferase (glyoxalase superfamily)